MPSPALAVTLALSASRIIGNDSFDLIDRFDFPNETIVDATGRSTRGRWWLVFAVNLRAASWHEITEMSAVEDGQLL